ncbi:ABC transporter permease [Micromonospora eburnea]|uniref:ABC-2 type transport system permease protein n=1 Tax=Micromonospora eburnea TaxID=227316 RepID=A0A1C6V1J9_9ACTN|nr:ABC transporter permease [Micromonospora eburnea]SCL60047.1 ABC-2 type transport system permease protein [Micromonospora eburnea]
MGDRLTATLWLLWDCSRMQARELAGHPLALIIGVVQPAVFLMITMGFDSAELGADRATQLAVAVILTSLWASTVWMAGGILHREQELGTLAANVASVHPGFLVLLGKCLGATVRTVLGILVAAGVTVVLIGAPVQLKQPELLLLGLVTVVASGTALGMLMSCLFLVTPYGMHLSSALMYPIFLLGGMLIPADVLPGPLQFVSKLISLHWAQEFLTGAALGHTDVNAYLIMVGLTVGYFVAAVWTFNRLVDHARRGGTLELV